MVVLLKPLTMNLEILSHRLIIFLTFIALASLTSCGSSKNVSKEHIYFQNGNDTVVSQSKETLIQSNDLLGIQVFSKTLNQEQAAIFNIPSTAGTSQGYQVNLAGNIELPVIGSVKAAGLTKDQLQVEITQKITSYVKNPSVLVKFLLFNVNVLGEVRSPGVQKFTVDRVTIIDALSAAGDLTDYGKRDNIIVIREEAGKKIYHTVDLRNRELFDSPVYVLQPNDIVYVSPTTGKLKSLSADPEAQRRTGLFFTVSSFIISFAAVIITVLR